ncbi:MAG: hypothetical protein JWN98_2165 [Abditibacteriota bacterium]|nr:hypothetical protein [Abditibacteriota bacterium]
MKSDAVTLRAIACPLLVAVGGVAVLSASVVAKPVKTTQTKGSQASSKATAARAPQTKNAIRPLPRYLPLKQIKDLQAARANLGWYAVQPLVNGKPVVGKMLPGAIVVPGADANVASLPRLKAKTAKVRSNAQRFPRPIAPAPVRGAATRAAVPRWVRYPLEFQLCGIGIGTRAVDKDRFNRIDRYGLFAMHGNPTAVVVPGQVAAGGGEAGGSGGSGGSSGGSSGSSGRGGSSGGSSGSGGSGGSGGAPAASAPGQNITVQQQPPEVSALFPAGNDGALPDWAAAITVQLDNNHVQWLYKRDTYAMGFVVDRLGFVDAIVCAGFASPIARTQLEDPVHTIKLGDDLRKVLFRYGYPDTIETYTVAVAGVGIGGATGGAGAEGSGAPGGAPPGSSGGSSGSSGGPEGEAGGAGAAAVGNNAYRTFEVRYEQSYNVVFTIRNNRVVRIYIFGDPDFFNDRRRRQFRVAY